MYAVKGDHLKVVETLVATETVDFPVVNKVIIISFCKLQLHVTL